MATKKSTPVRVKSKKETSPDEVTSFPASWATQYQVIYTAPEGHDVVVSEHSTVEAARQSRGDWLDRGLNVRLRIIGTGEPMPWGSLTYINAAVRVKALLDKSKGKRS